MTQKEWLDIGLEKGIIDLEDFEQITFKDAYREWFIYKMRKNKQPTVDRIEVTYNRYYRDIDLLDKYISKITDGDIITFLTRCCLSGGMTDRELSRIMQIVRGVLTYMRDINRGGASLHDWDKIKRNLPYDKLETVSKVYHAIDPKDVSFILHQVIDHKIYFIKQSACLCVCMNFYLGLRIGELSALKFSDFDFERNVVYVQDIESKYYNRDQNGNRVGSMVYHVEHRTKTKRSTREIPLVPEVIYLYRLIVAHHALQGYDSEFLAYDGNQTVLSRSIARTIAKLVKLCESKYFSSHGIRKTFATVLHHNNVPTRVISDLMGHCDISTTEKCYILSYEDKNDDYLRYMKNAINYVI